MGDRYFVFGSLLHELNNNERAVPIRNINAILHTFVFIFYLFG